MSAVQWRSLSSRLGSGLDGGPVGLVWREPVPAALEQPLRLWVHHTLTGTSFQTPSGPRRGIYRQWYEVATDRLALRMNIVPPFGGTGWPQHFAYATDLVMLLDVVDAILDLMPPEPPAGIAPIGPGHPLAGLVHLGEGCDVRPVLSTLAPSRDGRPPVIQMCGRHFRAPQIGARATQPTLPNPKPKPTPKPGPPHPKKPTSAGRQ